MQAAYHPYEGSKLGRQLRLHDEHDDNWLQELKQRLSRDIAVVKVLGTAL